MLCTDICVLVFVDGNSQSVVGCSHGRCGSPRSAVEPVCDLAAGVCDRWTHKPCYCGPLPADQATASQLFQRQGSACEWVCDELIIKSPVTVGTLFCNYCRVRSCGADDRWPISHCCNHKSWLSQHQHLYLYFFQDLLLCNELLLLSHLVLLRIHFAFSFAYLRRMNILEVIYVSSAFC